jgi:cytochrome c-type biogenesis protein
MPNLIEAPLALAAGALTVLSPCVLPMLPILFGTGAGSATGKRHLFVLAGFVSAFSALGMLLAVVSNSATVASDTMRTLALAILLASGLLRIWPGAYDRLMARFGNPLQRFSSPVLTADGNVGGFLLGVSLGAVWTPCAGPVLASILALVAQSQALAWSALLLALYAFGAAVPMLGMAYGGQAGVRRLRWLSRHGQGLQRGFGLLIALTAIAMYFHLDVQFSAWLLGPYQLKGL